MILERPISIVVYSRHSRAAGASAGRTASERYENFNGGCADYFLKILARVTPGPSGNEANPPHLRLLAQAVRQMVLPVLAADDQQANRCYTSFPAGIV
jgi:hypothetical protein